MRIVRLVIIAFAAVIAICSIAVATASAETFRPWHYLGPNQTGTVHISAGGKLIGIGNSEVTCGASKGTFAVAEPNVIENVQIKYKECKIISGTEECPAHSTSPVGGVEEIITDTLDGLLATADVPPLDPAVYLYSLLSNNGLASIQVEGTGCTSFPKPALVKGTIAGLILLPSCLTLCINDLHLLFAKADPKSVILLSGLLQEAKAEVAGTQVFLYGLALVLFPQLFRLC